MPKVPPSNPGESLHAIAMRQFHPMGYAWLQSYGSFAELPHGDPAYIRQAGLIQRAAEHKDTSADSQLYTGLYAVSREEFGRKLHFAAALAYPYRTVGDLPNEKQVQRYLADALPHPQAEELEAKKKQVPAFKARRHETPLRVNPMQPGHISPFTLGDRFRPGERFDDPAKVDAVSEVLFVLPEPGRYGKSILLPVGKSDYLRTWMRGYLKLLLHATTTEAGVHLVDGNAA